MTKVRNALECIAAAEFNSVDDVAAFAKGILEDLEQFPEDGAGELELELEEKRLNPLQIAAMIGAWGCALVAIGKITEPFERRRQAKLLKDEFARPWHDHRDLDAALSQLHMHQVDQERRLRRLEGANVVADAEALLGAPLAVRPY